MRPRELGLRSNYLGGNRTRYHLRSHQFHRSRCKCTIARLASPCVAHDFCNPQNPDALGDDSSFFAVTQQQWRACVRRMSRCGLACILPPSALDPGLASGAFAVATDENRDRFIGDRRPLNSRERSIGRAHSPYSPRLRRMIFGKSETVQITIRANFWGARTTHLFPHA